MGLFSKCLHCGKTKLSFQLNHGVCAECYAKMADHQGAENRETIDVSSFFQKTASDYSPPVADSSEATYVIVDVETTGLNPTEDAIVQISALRYFGREFIDGLNSYVDPHRSIPETATAIHGITDDKVKDSPTIDQIEEPFLKLVKDAIFVGHNVVFDLDFLNHAFHGALNGVEYIDTMRSSQAILSLPNYRLETVADYVEFYPEGGYHDALVDCTATAAVFSGLDLTNPFTLGRTIRRNYLKKTMALLLKILYLPRSQMTSNTQCGGKESFSPGIYQSVASMPLKWQPT